MYVFSTTSDLCNFLSGNIVASEMIETAAPVSSSIFSVLLFTRTCTSMGLEEHPPSLSIRDSSLLLASVSEISSSSWILCLRRGFFLRHGVLPRLGFEFVALPLAFDLQARAMCLFFPQWWHSESLNLQSAAPWLVRPQR